MKRIKRGLNYLCCLAYCQLLLPYQVVSAADKADKAVKEVTQGIDVLKGISLAIVSGIGFLILLWGLMDWGAARASQNTTEEHHALKKVIAGIVVVAVPNIINYFL